MPQPRNEPVPEARVDVPRARPQGALCKVISQIFFYIINQFFIRNNSCNRFWRNKFCTDFIREGSFYWFIL